MSNFFYFWNMFIGVCRISKCYVMPIWLNFGWTEWNKSIETVLIVLRRSKWPWNWTSPINHIVEILGKIPLWVHWLNHSSSFCCVIYTLTLRRQYWLESPWFYWVKVIFLSQISDILMCISRINEPIPGMFALIWMHFSWWFQIWLWNSTILKFINILWHF